MRVRPCFPASAGAPAVARDARQLAHRLRPHGEVALARRAPLHGLLCRRQPHVVALSGTNKEIFILFSLGF